MKVLKASVEYDYLSSTIWRSPPGITSAGLKSSLQASRVMNRLSNKWWTCLLGCDGRLLIRFRYTAKSCLIAAEKSSSEITHQWSQSGGQDNGRLFVCFGHINKIIMSFRGSSSSTSLVAVGHWGSCDTCHEEGILESRKGSDRLDTSRLIYLEVKRREVKCILSEKSSYVIPLSRYRMAQPVVEFRTFPPSLCQAISFRLPLVRDLMAPITCWFSCLWLKSVRIQ